MDKIDLIDFYEKLDERFNITNNDLKNATYTKVDCNFVYSSLYAKHRWFNYKEGFSPVLVEKLFDEFNICEGDMICDPFCGAGTTLLVAQKNGINSVGFEVNPFAAFITKIKTRSYSKDDVSFFYDEIKKLKNLKINENIVLPQNDYVCRIFEKEILVVHLNIKNAVNDIKNVRIRDLLYFAWLTILEETSLYRKAGNGLKKKSKKLVYDNAFEFVYDKIYSKACSMIEDCDVECQESKVDVYEKSAIGMVEEILPESLNLVLFSPPYANCFDYTKIYYLELWFGDFVKSRDEQNQIRMESIRSHCHATWPNRYSNFVLPELQDVILPLLKKQKLWTSKIPTMINGYFADMEQVLIQIYSALKHGGHCCIVVSNSSYAGIVVPTDVFLACIAEKIGFVVEEISVERLIITSSQQYKKTEHLRKYLRESIVKLRK